MASWLAQSEILLLFVVLFSGLLLGRVQVRGFSLGVSGVLFAGILFGAMRDPNGGALSLSHTLRDFGLVLFVYAVGLTSGPGFFRAFARGGVRLNLAVLGALSVAAAGAVGLGYVLGLDAGIVAGAYCGALTNTPALAAVVEQARGSAEPAAPTLAYSVTYPFGVFGALLLVQGLVRVRKASFTRELAEQSSKVKAPPVAATFRVRNPEVCDVALGALRLPENLGLLVSRVRHGEDTYVPNKYSVLHVGDTVTVVGSEEALSRAEQDLGPRSTVDLRAERSEVDARRFLVSRKALVGVRIDALQLDTKFQAQVTRLRRADFDIVPSAETRLERGDRLMVVAPTPAMSELGKFFGDSVRDASSVDFVGLAVGIALGLLVGMVPIPAPGGTLRLGIAGGPLLVALLLGYRGRTGPLLWSIPYESNLALRELGLLLFLAAVGTTAGQQLALAAGGTGFKIFVLGFALTLLSNVVLMIVLAQWTRVGVITSLGVAAAMQTQPATLAAAHELSHRSDEVYVAYAVAYPIAMVGKILLAQVIYFVAVAL